MSRPAVRADSPITIPLHIINLGTSADPEYKLGIYVGLGGGAPKLYEFDTGAAGFFAAYQPPDTPWWTSFTPSADTLNMTYASGILYNTDIVSTSVSLYASDAPGELPKATINNADVGQIETASGNTVANWSQDLVNGQAPLYGNFYGDFGMALYRNEGNDPVPASSNATTPSLYAIIPQLGANTSLLGNGFIIHMGNYTDPQPTLQIGLTADDRARFSVTIDMNAPTTPTATGTFPIGGGPSYSQQLITGNLVTNDGNATTESVNTVGAVLDTGAPTTEIHEYNGISVITPIDNMSFNGTDTQTGDIVTLMQYNTGSLKGLDAVGVTSGTNPLAPTGYVNTGLNIFFENDVMFDLENIVVGFAPAVVPEPAISALLAGLSLSFVCACRQYRKRQIKS